MEQVLRTHILGMVVLSIGLLGGCLGEKPPTDQESPTGTSMLPVPKMPGKMQDTSKDFEEDDHFLPLPNTKWRKAVYDGVFNDVILVSQNYHHLASTEGNVRAVLRLQSILNRGFSLPGMIFYSENNDAQDCDYETEKYCTVIVKFPEVPQFETPVRFRKAGRIHMIAFYDTELIDDFEHYNDQFEVWINFGKEQSHYVFDIKGFSKEFLEFEPLDPDLLKEIDSQ